MSLGTQVVAEETFTCFATKSFFCARITGDVDPDLGRCPREKQEGGNKKNTALVRGAIFLSCSAVGGITASEA